MPDADTVVFIPAWNEEKALPAVLDELRAGLPDADVLVIDDGSTDATAAAVGGGLQGSAPAAGGGSERENPLPRILACEQG